MSSHTYVRVVDLEWDMDIGAPRPTVRLDESQAVVSFDSVDGKRRVELTFAHCIVSTYGYPNDEALSGHPLNASGLTPYAFHEVEHSSWLDNLKNQNRKLFPEWNGWADLRHYVVTFHDSTFEALADSVVVRTVDPGQ